MTPASFALIQRLNQFLNRRTQLRVVTFICHRSTKFAPVPSHVVRHIHLRYSGANAAFVGSMFGATRLSGSVVHGSQRSAGIFTIWFGNFGVQDSTYSSGWETVPSRRQIAPRPSFHRLCVPSHADFVKTASQRNSKSARALRMLLTACNLPQRASS